MNKSRTNRFGWLATVGLAVPLHARFADAAGGGAGAGGAAGGGGAAAGGSAAGSGAQGGAGSGGSGGSYSPPPGHRLVSEADYGTLNGFKERATGYESKFQSLGLKDANDLDRFAPVFKAQPDHLRVVLAALTPAEKQAAATGGADGGPMTAAQIKAMVDEGIAAGRTEDRRTNAAREHDAAMGKVPDFIKAQLAEILGEDADEISTFEFDLMARGLMYKMREEAMAGQDPAARMAFMYPKDHPLHGERLAPWSAENTKGVWEQLKAHLPKRKGGVLAKIGDAAGRAPARSTPAGSGTRADDSAKGKKGWAQVQDGMVKDAMKTAATGTG